MLTPFKAIKNALHSETPQTSAENCMILSMEYAVFFVVILIIIFLWFLIDYGTDGILVFGYTWISFSAICIPILIILFLRGYLYVICFEKAVRNGTKLQGKIIRKKLHIHGGASRYTSYHIWIELDNGKVIKSPRYIYYPESYQLCDAYLYHGRYYFTEFRYSNGEKSWKNLKSPVSGYRYNPGRGMGEIIDTNSDLKQNLK